MCMYIYIYIHTYIHIYTYIIFVEGKSSIIDKYIFITPELPYMTQNYKRKRNLNYILSQLYNKYSYSPYSNVLI